MMLFQITRSGSFETIKAGMRFSSGAKLREEAEYYQSISAAQQLMSLIRSETFKD